MKTTGRTQLKDIFEAVVDLPAAERSRQLARRCGGDEELRGRIERLLAADDAAGSFLESSPFDEREDKFAAARAQTYIGRTIGTYRIEREIGSGGMGTVFLATRDPGGLDQQVAIKIVHQGVFFKEIVRRFLIERKILAGLEHAGIARLIDAGETADGLPYLVMEYVEGQPLDEYSRDMDQSIAQRLAIFRKVCSAVAYAHRRLIIHRDLKPSNILITPDGEAKLLDFGIAKLLDHGDADAAQTATLMNLLTPAYAAPEQVRGDAITTATDVYSLGIILYELLTGVRPFSFGDKTYHEIARVICETEPTAPSEIWREKDASKTGDTARDRGASTETSALPARRVAASELKGDLDNIVLKALRKDPERRYQSVEQFSEDIERYQKGLPVSARPDTFSYRAAKFFQRNRLAVVSSVVMVVLLVAGIVGTTWQAVRAARQQAIAEQRFAQVREIANNVIFKYHDSIANLQGSTEVRRMLVEDATKYLDNLSRDAGADEDLQNELALAYSKLADVQGKPYYANTGDTAGALENYQKSIALLETLAISRNAAISASAETELITIYHAFSSLNSRAGNFDEAVAVQSKALDLAKRYLAAAPEDLNRRHTFARANLWLGDAYAESGDFTAALTWYRGLITLAEANYASAPADRDAQTILGVAHDRIGRSFLLRGQELERTDTSRDVVAGIFRESYEHLAKTAELFKRVADENPADQKYRRNNAVAQSNLGMALRNIGELGPSLDILQKVAADSESDLAADPANRDAAAKHAEDLHQLALTLGARSQNAQAAARISVAIQNMDHLIAADGENMQLRRDRIQMVSDYGNMLLKTDAGEALKVLRAELEQPAGATAVDPAFTAYATGLIDEDIGDCYAQIAAHSATLAARRDDLKRSETYYQNAAAAWQSPTVRRIYFSRTPELLDYLDRKIAGG